MPHGLMASGTLIVCELTPGSLRIPDERMSDWLRICYELMVNACAHVGYCRMPHGLMASGVLIVRELMPS
jgi:hypothetical protein